VVTSQLKLKTQPLKIFSQPDLNQILAQNHQLYQRKRDLAYAKLQALASKGLIIANQPPEGGIYITVKLANSIDAEKFLYWSLTKYNGPICTFVPLVTESGSFYTAEEKDSHRDEIRLCLGLPKDQIQEAIKAFANQLRAFINHS
jgi:aspartate/methionine/tyrosine aminotransferase